MHLCWQTQLWIPELLPQLCFWMAALLNLPDKNLIYFLGPTEYLIY